MTPGDPAKNAELWERVNFNLRRVNSGSAERTRGDGEGERGADRGERGRPPGTRNSFGREVEEKN